MYGFHCTKKVFYDGNDTIIMAEGAQAYSYNQDQRLICLIDAEVTNANIQYTVIVMVRWVKIPDMNCTKICRDCRVMTSNLNDLPG